MDLFADEQRRATKTVEGNLARLLRGQPTLHAGFDLRLEMKCQLVVNLALDAGAANEIAKTGPAAVPANHGPPQVGLRIIEIAADSRSQSRCSRARCRWPARVSE